MKEKRFRLVFNGLSHTEQKERLLVFFKREVGLSDKSIKTLLTSPPRIIVGDLGAKDAEMLRTALEKLGCRIILEPLMHNVPEPFSITEKHYRIVKKELSKILRVCSCLAFVVVKIDRHQGNEAILPSMMGEFEVALAGCFRESDTVIGIDDDRFIMLGFSTNDGGTECLREKVIQSVKGLLEEQVSVSCGTALFPREGQSLLDLLHLAESRRNSSDGAGDITIQLQTEAIPDMPYLSSSDETAEDDPITQCFAKAYGKIFKRLCTMDLKTLYAGLCQLPRALQREFIDRLPYDFHQVGDLESLLEQQSQPLVSNEIRQRYQAILYHMEMEREIEDRDTIKKEVEGVLRNTESLPTLPTVAAQVFHIASDQRSSADDLANVIMLDQALTSKLLKIVNSAFYGFRQEIGTVKQAVVILGLDDIVNLSIGLSAAKVFDTRSDNGLFSPKKLWHHSIGTAMIAHALCEKFPEYQKHGIFTAGLLHDFGKIILMEKFPELYHSLDSNIKKYGLSIVELEKEMYGLNHASIGQLISQNWNMPRYLVESIAYHHHPSSAQQYPVMAAIVGLADYLYHRIVRTHVIEEEIPDVYSQLTVSHAKILKPFFPHIDNRNIEELIEKTEDIMEKNKSAFDILM